jgi:anti-sigma-K factor RskA
VTCERAPEFVGAYVLGALDPGERRVAEEHLRDCPACAAEVAEFRGLIAQLDRVRPEDLQPEAPPADLYARVAAAVGRGRARRRWAVAAAEAAVLVTAGGVVRLVADDAAVRGEATAGPVTMSVVATERSEGSSLEVTVDGLHGAETCRLFVVDESGERIRAGEWSATYQGEASYETWTEVEPGELTDVVLLDTDWSELVRVTF